MNIWPLWSQVGDQAEGIVSFKPVASVADVAAYLQKNKNCCRTAYRQQTNEYIVNLMTRREHELI